MASYFNLLRQHQEGDQEPSTDHTEAGKTQAATTTTPQPLPESHDDDALLADEDVTAPEQKAPAQEIENILLCEEETTPAPDTPLTTPLPAHENAADETTGIETATSNDHSMPVKEPPINLVSQPNIDSAPPTVPDKSPPLTTATLDGGLEGETAEAQISEWLNRCMVLLHDSFRHCRQDIPYNFTPLQQHIHNLLLWLERDDLMINLLELEISHVVAKEDPDPLTPLVMKSIMLLLYCIKITIALRIPQHERLPLMLAATLHHIGMAKIPTGILTKRTRLAPDELAEIRAAPSRGSQYLGANNINDDTIIRACEESSERIDGTGPRAMEGEQIILSARIVGLLSMFEAMIHFRPYRKRMLPREAIRVIVNDYKQAFDRKILKALLDSISLYPIGTYVKMNSHEIGLVTFTYPRLPLRPRVRITMDAQGHEVTMREVNLRDHPNLMINACVYAENLTQLTETETR
ncbi:MAG: hypothetical protein R8J84_01725 [Mariprofundales bacterium]